ncbi:MAG: hypothetical protein IJM07_01955, partial [Pyramidobacter sp.]|nr:hypothetical protein [Pyramidobacter sp.]
HFQHPLDMFAIAFFHRLFIKFFHNLAHGSHSFFVFFKAADFLGQFEMVCSALYCTTLRAPRRKFTR